MTDDSIEIYLTCYVFWTKRPQDKQAWPTVFLDEERAKNYQYRVSEVQVVKLQRNDL